MHGFIQRKNKQTKIIRFSFSVRRGFVSQRVWHSSQRCWYRPKKKKKRLCLRILFVSPFHCVKPGAIISFGKLLLQHFFQQVLIFKYSFTTRNTHTQRKTNTKKKQKQSTLKNYTEKNELHTLQINAPFNCLKQDIIARASRVQKWAKGRRGSFVNAKNAEKFFIQVPLVLIYMIEKSLIWADDGQPRP